MHSEVLEYVADGATMVSHLYYDDSLTGRRPGVLVFADAFGLGAQAKDRAERLAALGFVALACDYHGDGMVVSALDEAIGAITPLRDNPARLRGRARAGLDAIKACAQVDPARIAAIGYCFGGTTALELARSGADIAGAVGFHSGLATASPQDARNIRGKVLVCIGADDPAISPEERTAFEQEMRDANIDWQMHLYGGVVHSFTNTTADRLGRPDFARYDARADARSWAAMRLLFDDIF